MKVSKSSVECLGSRDPASSTDFDRRAKEKGVIDLTNNTKDDKTVGWKRKAQEFSTPGGKRRKVKIVSTNLSRFVITLQEQWNQGAFRWVHTGRYAPDPRIPGDNGGPQNGELCVLKEFKSGSVYEDSFFQSDIKAVAKAAEIVDAFNAHNDRIGMAYGRKTIRMNKPEVWEDVYPDDSGKKKKKLVEPLLEGGFLKFNSNSGYVNGADFMQALSHFSYHCTRGKYLLCDLQGGHYESCYVLTDPVIMSMDNEKYYGSTDLGSEGINNFFAYHKCTRFCHRYWLQLKNPRPSSRIPCLQSTSMSLEIGIMKPRIDQQKTMDAILSKKYW